MKMTYLMIAASLGLATPVAATATTTETQSFEHDGIRYSYVVTTKGDTRILSGVVENTGRPFHLKVANGRVSGTIESRSVSFKLSEVKKMKSTTQIAAR